MIGLRIMLTFCLAWLIMISDKTAGPGNNETGDIVVITENLDLNAREKTLFLYKEVPGTAAEVRATLNAKMPKIMYDEHGQEARWENKADGKYYDIKKKPDYPFTAKGLTGDWKLDDVKIKIKEYPENNDTFTVSP